jgi:hypothetical protein
MTSALSGYDFQNASLRAGLPEPLNIAVYIDDAEGDIHASCKPENAACGYP